MASMKTEILEGLESDTDEETELQILMIFIVIILFAGRNVSDYCIIANNRQN